LLTEKLYKNIKIKKAVILVIEIEKILSTIIKKLDKK